jgi:hypothetical protein
MAAFPHDRDGKEGISSIHQDLQQFSNQAPEQAKQQWSLDLVPQEDVCCVYAVLVCVTPHHVVR